MKCLLLADLHYDLRKFDWVLAVAAHVDVVVLAGDHLDLASTVDRPAQAIVAQQYFRRIRAKAPLLICSGNHDLDHCDSAGEYRTRWITNARFFDVPTDGDSKQIGDTLFTICPWSNGKMSRAEIERQLARDSTARPTRWVWVHHVPPNGSPISWDGRRMFGDVALRKWIERFQPDLVLSGHVHQSPFTAAGSWADRIGTSWVFNAGHQIGPLPSHIVVDTTELGAYWVSLEAAEGASLDQPPNQPLGRPFPAIADPPAWLVAMGQAAIGQAAMGRAAMGRAADPRPAETSPLARG